MNPLLRLISLNAARVLFVGVLLLALYAGLQWALAIEARPDASAVAEAQAARELELQEAEASEAAALASESEAAAAEEAAGPTPTPEPTIAPEELIAAAEPPAETSVQVLDSGGGNAAVDAVVATLEGFGYEVVAINRSQRRVETTTIYFVGDNEPQAEALRARDPRFQEIEPNQGLSEGVDLHVLVGSTF